MVDVGGSALRDAINHLKAGTGRDIPDAVVMNLLKGPGNLPTKLRILRSRLVEAYDHGIAPSEALDLKIIDHVIAELET